MIEKETPQNIEYPACIDTEEGIRGPSFRQCIYDNILRGLLKKARSEPDTFHFPDNELFYKE